MVSKQSYSPVTTLSKALSLLELIAEMGSARSVELAHGTGLSRSTVNRLLATLQEKGYVESRDGKYFQLGFKVFVIGNSVPKRNQLAAIARPFLVHLAEASQENVNLAILHNRQVLYIDKVESPHYVKLDKDIGTTDPVHCTALGKVLLTGLTDRELDLMVAAIDLTRKTSATVTEPDSLIASVKEAARKRCATDMGELSEEIRCMAAPVMDREKRVVAAISISAPASRLTPERMTALRPFLLDAALGISRTMGYSEANAD